MKPIHHITTGDLARLALSLLAMVVALRDVTAQDRLSAGANVTFRTLYSYDSNLFLTKDAQSDKLSTYALNFGAELGSGTARIGFGGDIEDKHYETYTDEDDTSYDLKANASIGGEPFRFSASSQHIHTIASLDTTNLTRVERDTARGQATIEATPAYLFGIILSGDYEDTTYVGNDEYEYLQTGGSISVYGKYDKHTRVGLKYVLSSHDYDEDIRYDAKTTRLTSWVDYEYAGDLRTRVEIGYEVVEFQVPSSTTAEGETAEGETAEGAYARASAKYLPNKRWGLDAQLKRSISLSNSPDSNFNTKLEAGLGFSYRPVPGARLKLSTYYTHTDEDTTFDNDTYGAELKVAYALSKWAEVTLDYGYNERNADIPDNDYNRYVVSAGLVLRW